MITLLTGLLFGFIFGWLWGSMRHSAGRRGDASSTARATTAPAPPPPSDTENDRRQAYALQATIDQQTGVLKALRAEIDRAATLHGDGQSQVTALLQELDGRSRRGTSSGGNTATSQAAEQAAWDGEREQAHALRSTIDRQTIELKELKTRLDRTGADYQQSREELETLRRERRELQQNLKELRQSGGTGS